MQNQSGSPLGNQHGLAMVLAVSMIALLSTIAVWMIMESRSNLQTTKAYERTEATSYLAQSACWFDVRVLDTKTPSLPSSANLTAVDEQSQTSDPPGKIGTAPVDLGSGKTFTREIKSANDFYNTIHPEGWMLNEPSRYYTKYYLGHGTGRMEISGTRGSARSKMVNFVEKVAR
jgi:hypothetical protein